MAEATAFFLVGPQEVAMIAQRPLALRWAASLRLSRNRLRGKPQAFDLLGRPVLVPVVLVEADHRIVDEHRLAFLGLGAVPIEQPVLDRGNLRGQHKSVGGHVGRHAVGMMEAGLAVAAEKAIDGDEHIADLKRRKP